MASAFSGPSGTTRVACCLKARVGIGVLGPVFRYRSIRRLSRVSRLGFGGVIERLKRPNEVGILRIGFEASDNGAGRPTEIALSDETLGRVRRRRLDCDRGHRERVFAVGPSAPVGGV